MRKLPIVVCFVALLSAFNANAAYTPTGVAAVTATSTSQNVALPTNSGSSPAATTILVTNLSATSAVWVALGGSGVAVSTTTGQAILPGQAMPLGIGTNTYVAYYGSGQVNISTGY